MEVLVHCCLLLRTTHSRLLNPTALAQISALLKVLISKGCRNAVVFPARLEAACVAFCGLPTSVKIAHESVTTLGGQLSTHIQAALALLRQYTQENQQLGRAMPGGAMFPKTGAFRKLMQYSDRVIVEQLSAMLNLRPAADRSASPSVKTGHSPASGNGDVIVLADEEEPLADEVQPQQPA